MRVCARAGNFNLRLYTTRGISICGCVHNTMWPPLLALAYLLAGAAAARGGHAH